jgi:hypothetical protein
MAGVKVTDLTALGTAAPDDILYIVDTTADQSRKIEVQDIYSGMPQFESGEFTPTITGANDCTPSCLKALYSRVGDIVTCSYYMSTLLDVGLSVGSYNISPPIASVFTSPRDAFGVVGTITDPYLDLVSSEISADTGFGQITHRIEILTAGSTLNYVVNMQYIIRP